MSASSLSFLRSGPPPPKVVLLPDALFFSRRVPVTPGATTAEATAQVELALEALSPFPLAQLYYGWYWVPGADHAFAYASYRRRFTAEQAASWADAELVIPASVALFGGEVQPATALVLAEPTAVTAVYWDHPSIPARVVVRPVEEEANEDQRAAVRDEVLRRLGGTRAVVDLLVPPTAEASLNERETIFRSGDFVSRLPRDVVTSLDVRDKGELAALRAARKRDVVLWRVVMGCAAALLLFALGEVALIGGDTWQKGRIGLLNKRAPAVQKIKEAQDLASSIQDLVTKRFLPLEMVTSVVGTNADRKPGDIVITRIQSNTAATSRGLYTLILEFQTTNPSQVPVYRAAIEKLSECEAVNVEPLSLQGDRSLYRMTVVFKPGALKPEQA